MKCVSNQDPCSILERTIQDTILEDSLADIGIDSGERIIQKYDIRVGISSSGERHTRLLAALNSGQRRTRRKDSKNPTTEIYTSLADLSLLPGRQHFQVMFKITRLDNLVESEDNWINELIGLPARTSSYLSSSSSCPKRTFSLNVAFRIQAVCGTYATEPPNTTYEIHVFRR
jgi:hypothetical protein